LSEAAAVSGYTAARPTWRFGRKIGDWTIGLIVFLGGFVIYQPAPYELLLVPVVLVWSFFGLKLNRAFMPLVFLLLVYTIGGILSLTQLPSITSGLVYMITSLFLVVSAVFFAAVVAEAPLARLTIIKHAYIAAAIVSSLAGIGGYFHVIPYGDLFLRYGRVMGVFQDPNVFAPFLALPIALLFRDVLTERLRKNLFKVGLLLVLLLAEFLAFSRAAWGLTALALGIVGFTAYLDEPRQLGRFRIVAFFVAGLVAVALLVTVALSIPAVYNLFLQRAQLLESYDAGHLGRFARQAIGFFLVQQHPLGIGPEQFGKLLGEDEHNMWLKGFTTYGWLGGFSYIILVIWTLAASFPLLFKKRPWTPIVQCAFAVYAGHIMIHNVIDNDHWRHLFLLYGLLWGAVAADRMHLRRAHREAALRGTRPLVPRRDPAQPIGIERAAPPGGATRGLPAH
jgi:hypothetical protein